jgi:hypothetical protein
MNRGDQLRGTLEHNLNVIEQFEGRVELCLVNFIKDEEGERIHEWICSLGVRPYFNYAVSKDLKYWHAPKAKNTSHSLGAGYFLVNLDCDNFISHAVTNVLLGLQREQLSNTVFSAFSGGFREAKVKRGKPLARALYQSFARALNAQAVKRGVGVRPKSKAMALRSVRTGADRDFNGTYGNIGLPRSLFWQLGGYDESFPPMGAQDKDLLWRAYNLNGMSLLHFPQPMDERPLSNSKEDSLKNSDMTRANWSLMEAEASAKAIESIRLSRLIANKGSKIGCCTFSDSSWFFRKQ